MVITGRKQIVSCEAELPEKHEKQNFNLIRGGAFEQQREGLTPCGLEPNQTTDWAKQRAALLLVRLMLMFRVNTACQCDFCKYGFTTKCSSSCVCARSCVCVRLNAAAWILSPVIAFKPRHDVHTYQEPSRGQLSARTITRA